MEKLNFKSKLFKFEEKENDGLEFVIGGLADKKPEECSTKAKKSSTSSAGECYTDTDNKRGKEECRFEC